MVNDINQNPKKIDTNGTTLYRETIRECLWMGQADAEVLVLTINGVDISFTHTDTIDGAKNKYLFGHSAPLGRVDSFVAKTIPAGSAVYVFND